MFKTAVKTNYKRSHPENNGTMTKLCVKCKLSLSSAVRDTSCWRSSVFVVR